MGGFTGRCVAEDQTSQTSAALNKVAVCELSTTDGNVFRLERARTRSTRCCRPDRRDVVSRPVWAAQTRTPSSGVPGNKQGDPWDSSARRRDEAVLGRRACGERPAKPTPEPSMSDPRSVAVLPGGALLPAPSRPHRQGPPPSEFPGSKQEPAWVPGQRRRDDPQAVFGRLACGERLANPMPTQ
jgi:hypothetical protein